MDSAREQLERHRREAERLERQITNFEERQDDDMSDKLTYTEALVEVTTALRYVEKQLDTFQTRVVEDIGIIKKTMATKNEIKRLWWAVGLIFTTVLALLGLAANFLRP